MRHLADLLVLLFALRKGKAATHGSGLTDHYPAGSINAPRSPEEAAQISAAIEATIGELHDYFRSSAPDG
jgi:hypothetical protein